MKDRYMTRKVALFVTVTIIVLYIGTYWLWWMWICRILERWLEGIHWYGKLDKDYMYILCMVVWEKWLKVYM
jgi:hypothetical protein